MKFLIFSDLHAHNFKYRSEPVEIDGFKGLYNSRLRDTVTVLREIKQYALDNGIKDLIFGGDLFHNRKKVDVDVLYVIHRCFEEMSNAGLVVRMILGNHDIKDRKGTSFSPCVLSNIRNVFIFPHTGSLEIEDVKFHLVSYSDDRVYLQQQFAQCAEDVAEDKKNILIGHCGMQGAVVGSDYVLVSKNDVAVKDIPYNQFYACFFGHFHEHQKLFSNGWFIGSTHQHNWGDSGGKRGFLVVDTFGDKVSFERIETSAPRFLYDQNLANETDFVSVPKAKKSKSQPPSFSLSDDKLNPYNMVEEWLDFKNPSNKKTLHSLGKSLLSKVESL